MQYITGIHALNLTLLSVMMQHKGLSCRVQRHNKIVGIISCRLWSELQIQTCRATC